MIFADGLRLNDIIFVRAKDETADADIAQRLQNGCKTTGRPNTKGRKRKMAAKDRQKNPEKTRLFHAAGKVDLPFLVILLLLVVIGLACMFSAGFANAYYYQKDSYFFIKKQLVFAVIGLVAMTVLSFVNYRIWHRLALPVTGISLILLVVVLFIPSSIGIHRWIPLPFVGQFQPSELAKFALIVLFAHIISLNYREMKTFKKGFLPFILILAVFCALILREPHLSGTILIFAIGCIMMFVGGTRPVYLIGTIILGLIGVYVMVFQLGYEQDRVQVWLNLEEVYAQDRDAAWQTMQSLYAIGSGGIMGKGFGNSFEKHLFLPEPQNDFVFSIVCEELGFVGAVLILLLFAALVWRGFVIAMRAPDKFGFLMAIGLTSQIAVQVVINVAVVTNLLPNTGISLPFFSYGGSSLVMLMAQMGIMLAISKQRREKKSKQDSAEQPTKLVQPVQEGM